MASFYNEGLYFSCTKCSDCCRHESGIVLLSEKDVNILMEFIVEAEKIEYNCFIETYCRWVPVGTRYEQLSLKEKANFDCIFWEENGCSVYPARPLQCRAFPFWHSLLDSSKTWNHIAKYCSGIGKGTLVTRNEIEIWLKKQTSEPIITRKT